MAIVDPKTGRHIFYEADHGIQRDPLRDLIRERFPTSKQGWNVIDCDLIVCLFGVALERDRDSDGWMIEFEAKKNGAELKYAQKRIMCLRDRLMFAADPSGKHWGGTWLLRLADDLTQGRMIVWRPLTNEQHEFHGIDGMRKWIESRAPGKPRQENP